MSYFLKARNLFTSDKMTIQKDATKAIDHLIQDLSYQPQKYHARCQQNNTTLILLPEKLRGGMHKVLDRK